MGRRQQRTLLVRHRLSLRAALWKSLWGRHCPRRRRHSQRKRRYVPWHSYHDMILLWYEIILFLSNSMNSYYPFACEFISLFGIWIHTLRQFYELIVSKRWLMNSYVCDMNSYSLWSPLNHMNSYSSSLIWIHIFRPPYEFIEGAEGPSTEAIVGFDQTFSQAGPVHQHVGWPREW